MISIPSKPHVTGSQAYTGGKRDDGRPALSALFEYNTAYSMTYVGLIALFMHEVMPGHHLHSVMTDLNLDLDVEATMPTMCSPQVALWEGVAQNALNFLFDDREEAYRLVGKIFDVDPKDVEIQYAIEALIDAAKHDGSILGQREGWSEGGVKAYARDMCALTDPLPNKIWGWGKHPLIGPMYGVTYDYGNKKVARAIRDHGRLAVARVGYNTKGLVDIETFRKVLEGELEPLR
ncbi:hypothetical protein COV18_06490 [Candidatus Woesearchaeota archaeon CG10_big_fil_rev_8_21_14_0_10_37_12]|nr:MAG: hypothetical protein COV18_06490 [Candidatus Woesearchaeota archaeon CG10_big_fil_rev_8_21_14_0_10_37_12]